MSSGPRDVPIDTSRARAEAARRPRRRVSAPMPAKYEPLAVYNAEVSRGIVHTPEYDAAMTALQREFNAWSRGDS